MHGSGHLTPVGPRMRYGMDAAKGVGYLQKRNFVHRDIAARNILLQKGSCKIGDFGMSTPLANGGEYYKSSGGKVPLRWCVRAWLSELALCVLCAVTVL